MSQDTLPSISEVTVRCVIPVLMHLYEEANLQVPTFFNPDVEGPRLVAALRTQGIQARIGR